VILIKVPSLNEREDDIPMLANYFVGQICENNGRPPIQFTDNALDELKKIKWTGNIRELRNVVERLVILCDQQITVEDVQMYAQPARR
jgi:DNA-binding NtrC family response regulator